jgi:hypothetical protein
MRLPRAATAGLLAAAALAVAGPAAHAAAPNLLPLQVTAGSASADMTFVSDPRTCARVGRCGHQGRVELRLGGRTQGGGVFGRLGPRIRGYGGATFPTGVARATVGIAGTPAACRDAYPHHSAAFSLQPRPGNRALVRFMALGVSAEADSDGQEDVFSTRCPGPRLLDVAGANALPTTTISLVPLRAFRPVTATFRSRHSFTRAGYRVTITWRATLRFLGVRDSD